MKMPGEPEETEYSIYTENLTYTYPSKKVALANINLKIPRGCKVLIVGPNGAGKSTLLKVLAGQKLIKSGKILLNGVDPFAFNNASNSGKTVGVVAYLGTEWANNEITKRDIPVTVLISSIGGDLFPERRDKLIEILDIDIEWRMNQISDGERRRVQLAMGLLKPFDLLLLDEVTVDLDVLVRSKLLQFLSDETHKRNATVVYATHIFDGLGSTYDDDKSWPSRIIHLTGGQKLQDLGIDQIEYYHTEGTKRKVEDIEETQERIKIPKVDSLHPLALNWLVKDLAARGDRKSDRTRLTFEELEKLLESKYYDAGKHRVTDYFKNTRTTK